VDGRVAALAAPSPELLERFFEVATRRRAYDGSDPEPCDISIIPRVVTAVQATEFAAICRPIVAASLGRVLDVHAGRDHVAGWSLDWITRSVARLPDHLVGNVRLDFLLEGGRPRLLEGGWVNLSAVDYAPQAAFALLDVEPELRSAFTVQRPAEKFRERLLEQGVRRLAILVKEKRSIYSQHDWELIQEVLAPIDSVVIAEQDFSSIQAGEGVIIIDGKPCDAVYLRALDGPAAFAGSHAATNRETLVMLLESGVLFHDHPLTLLVEDKDLGWLVERDPSLDRVVPRTCRPADVAREDARRWVLKLRDLHSGEGVFLEEQEMLARWDAPDAILQERIEPDRFPVRTVHGLAGDAVADLAVHVSYRYDVARRELVTAEVAGYFSRFSLTSGKVNLCKGGGIVPVLCERTEGKTTHAATPV
jgi:hypothetical protein